MIQNARNSKGGVASVSEMLLDLGEDGDVGLAQANVDTSSASTVAVELKRCSPQPSQSVTQKRSKYVPSACINCQLHKVKCSGQLSCAYCRTKGLVCEYKQQGRKRRAPSSQGKPDDGGDDGAEPSGKRPSTRRLLKDDRSARMDELMARIAELESNYTSLLSQARSVQSSRDSGSPATNSNKQDYLTPGTDSTFATLPEKAVFRGASTMVAQFHALDRSIAQEPLSGIQSRVQSRAVTPDGTSWTHLPRSIEMNLAQIERETRFKDLQAIYDSVDVFFTCLNPHYPCLNENAFRALLQKFLANEEQDDLSYADKQQFIALVNLIHAEVRILSDKWPTSALAPAWDEFCRAESILTRLTWLGNGNIMTIQCLVIKARYLLYAEKACGAYDTMGRLVRLCWQLGLNCKSSWTGLSDYEIIMRQQIFWTCFYLDRHISLLSGFPYLIRLSDVDIPLPPNVDQNLVFPNCPLPPLNQGSLVHPYLESAKSWGSLASEVWDAIYSVDAQRPTSAELIAALDARILFKKAQIPEFLQWKSNAHKLDGNSDTPRYIIRQSAILNLRMDLLRLSLRQGRVSSLDFDDDMARDCVEIASAIVDAVSKTHYSPVHTPLDRFSSCLSLVSAVLPLIGVAAKPSLARANRSQAIDSYSRLLAILRDMAPTFGAARHVLRSLSHLIRITERAILHFQQAEPVQFDQDADFDFSGLMSQMPGAFGIPEQQEDWELGFLNGSLDGPFSLYQG